MSVSDGRKLENSVTENQWFIKNIVDFAMYNIPLHEITNPVQSSFSWIAIWEDKQMFIHISTTVGPRFYQSSECHDAYNCPLLSLKFVAYVMTKNNVLFEYIFARPAKYWIWRKTWISD